MFDYQQHYFRLCHVVQESGMIWGDFLWTDGERMYVLKRTH